MYQASKQVIFCLHALQARCTHTTGYLCSMVVVYYCDMYLFSLHHSFSHQLIVLPSFLAQIENFDCFDDILMFFLKPLTYPFSEVEEISI